jgi:hypothetical protein
MPFFSLCKIFSDPTISCLASIDSRKNDFKTQHKKFSYIFGAIWNLCTNFIGSRDFTFILKQYQKSLSYTSKLSATTA